MAGPSFEDAGGVYTSSMVSTARPVLVNDEVDGKALLAIVQRFQRHHALRYQQSRRRMPRSQRLLLEALPILYHSNHPGLPGFVNHRTPCGIPHYRPSPLSLAAARRLSRSYQEQRFNGGEPSLQAIFIMGSGGSIGQTRNSDIDLWICCDSKLHGKLWPKVTKVNAWAASLGLDLHAFLVDPEILRLEHRLPGTYTPALLMDEFYRSAVLLAGRYPMWWLIDEDDPEAYAATVARLLQQRFVPRDRVIDFGPVPAFPPDEIAHAAAVELSRSLHTPHKSLMKLKLMEAYAQAPDRPTLSSKYRRRIHEGEENQLRLDPYLLLYEHLEAYCRQAPEASNLQLIRRLLVSKTAENAEPTALQSSEALEAQLSNLFHAWGFSAADIRHLRSPDTWTISERKSESDDILAAIAAGMTLTRKLLKRAGPDTPLGWLNENKLQHLTSAAARLTTTGLGEISRLHPAMVGGRQPVTALLRRRRSGWSLGDDQQDRRREDRQEHQQDVYRSNRLVPAIFWTELNRVRLKPDRSQRQALRVMAQIRQGLRESQCQLRVFVNAEPPGPSEADGAFAAGVYPLNGGITMLTDRRDPLDYSGFQSLRISSFDLLTSDAEGRWHARVFTGQAELIAAMAHLMAQTPERLSWHVIGGQERFGIRRRLELLHESGFRTLSRPSAVFVMPFGRDNVVLVHGESGIQSHRFTTLAELQSFLSGQRATRVHYDPDSRRFAALSGSS